MKKKLIALILAGMMVAGSTASAETISWGYDNEGNLCFFGATGEKLVINRGSSYISFVKSSEKNNVKIS